MPATTYPVLTRSAQLVRAGRFLGRRMLLALFGGVLGSTGLGEGVAIPHGRIKGLKQPLAAFVRLADPIPFESPDGQPVSLLIFLLVPEQATQQHLEILSEIAQLLSDREARERLHTEEDREALHRLLTQWQP